jgi:hypothetical protein
MQTHVDLLPFASSLFLAVTKANAAITAIGAAPACVVDTQGFANQMPPISVEVAAQAGSRHRLR